MLSFGAVFPFLAFILFITAMGQTKYAEYRIGQYLESIVTCDTMHFDEKVQRVGQLNDELRDIQQIFIRSLWQVVPCIGPFYAIFVFDIIGDASSAREAIFAPLILLFTGVAIYLTPLYYPHGVNDETSNNGSSRSSALKLTLVRPVDRETDSTIKS